MIAFITGVFISVASPIHFPEPYEKPMANREMMAEETRFYNKKK